MEFEVGDIITGKPHNGYNMTDENAIMVVKKILDRDSISVMIIADKRGKSYLDCDTFDVDRSGFIPVDDPYAFIMEGNATVLDDIDKYLTPKNTIEIGKTDTCSLSIVRYTTKKGDIIQVKFRSNDKSVYFSTSEMKALHDLIEQVMEEEPSGKTSSVRKSKTNDTSSSET